MKLSIYRKKMTLRHISGDGKMLEHKPLKAGGFRAKLKAINYNPRLNFFV